MSGVPFVNPNGGLWEVEVARGCRLQLGDKVTMSTFGAKKAIGKDIVWGVVERVSKAGVWVWVRLIDNYTLRGSVPFGALEVCDEVDLETGYGGRV